MFLLIVFFYLKYFPHEVKIVICLKNLYHKMILPTAAMYWSKNLVEQVLEIEGEFAVSCDK